MDRYSLPGFDRRRGWIFFSQCLLITVIILMAFSDPRESIHIMGILALVIAFLSASQDVAFDAYRADMLTEKDRGMGAGISVTAYRIALIVSGAGVLIMADPIGWAGGFPLFFSFFLFWL